jgi:hypothetical protein
VRHATKVLRKQIGPIVSQAFSNLGSMLDAWARRTLNQLQLRFESHADTYRAHLNRMSGRGDSSSREPEAIRRDLAALNEVPTEIDQVSVP